MNNSVMEPYSISRRSNTSILYNPYFINYGGDKENFYYVLNTMSRLYSLVFSYRLSL